MISLPGEVARQVAQDKHIIGLKDQPEAQKTRAGQVYYLTQSQEVKNAFSMISGIVPMVEVFPLEQASQAFEKMVSSKVHFRSVLKMDGNA
jgi:D-arabinose 1-dehydrogenase-like Zn-dependent alcohol dehydrogenase